MYSPFFKAKCEVSLTYNNCTYSDVQSEQFPCIYIYVYEHSTIFKNTILIDFKKFLM